MAEVDAAREKNKELYKAFGRETGIGKMLFSMYGANKEKPQVYYPPVKAKTKPDPEPEAKPCPQMTQIEYPEVRYKPRKKYAAIDFVPRRKPGEDILAQIEEDKNRPLGRAPGKAGVDRKALVE